MLECLVLRLDAPLMSFGAPAVDDRRTIQGFPALSMLTGLLGNALGWTHRDADALQRLQERIRYASRCDRRGDVLVDYQTADLGLPHMLANEVGWTTWGWIEDRAGGSAKTMTHQRRCEYHADSVHTVVLSFEPPHEGPTLDDLEQALEQPARPLFIGRKACLPAGPIFDPRHGRIGAASLREALERVPAIPAARRQEPDAPLEAWWPSEDSESGDAGHILQVTDERDWRNQIHGGRRFIFHGLVKAQEAPR